MVFLKQLFNQLQTRSHDPAVSDALGTLQALQSNHELIDLHFSGVEQLFQSMILQLRPGRGYMVIDNLCPAPEADGITLRNGDGVEISCHSPLFSGSFYSRLQGRRSRNGTPVYRLELPKTLTSHHYRESYRFQLGEEPGLAINLRSASGTAWDGRIIDLSRHGIRLDIDGDVSSQLLSVQEPLTAHIQLPDGEIEGQLAVRNFQLRRQPRRHTLTGARLDLSEDKQQSILNHFLANNYQRQEQPERQPAQ